MNYHVQRCTINGIAGFKIRQGERQWFITYTVNRGKRKAICFDNFSEVPVSLVPLQSLNLKAIKREGACAFIEGLCRNNELPSQGLDFTVELPEILQEMAELSIITTRAANSFARLVLTLYAEEPTSGNPEYSF